MEASRREVNSFKMGEERAELRDVAKAVTVLYDRFWYGGLLLPNTRLPLSSFLAR